MAKSSNIFELKNRPTWLVRVVTIIALIFVFSLLSAVASGARNWLGIIIIFFIVALMLLYGAYFLAEAIEIVLGK